MTSVSDNLFGVSISVMRELAAQPELGLWEVGRVLRRIELRMKIRVVGRIVLVVDVAALRVQHLRQRVERHVVRPDVGDAARGNRDGVRARRLGSDGIAAFQT